MWQYQELDQHIEHKIMQYEYTAEEYFQELDDPERGNEYLAKAAALKELLEWWYELRKIPQNNLTT